MKPTRFAELDSLRGLAAFTVVIDHCLMSSPVFAATDSGWAHGPVVSVLKNTPVHLIWAGHEAVIFFFVLSGFVLSLPFHDGQSNSYNAYLVKRFFRIYIPYICAVGLAFATRAVIEHPPIITLSSWFNAVWAVPLSAEVLIRHILLLPWFDDNQSAPVFWSLIHEMRISLIFPFIMWIVVGTPWRRTVALAIAMVFAGYFLGRLTGQAGDLGTVSYTAMFILGALLAKHRIRVIDQIRGLNAIGICGLFGAAVLAYTVSWWLELPLGPPLSNLYGTTANDLVISCGALLFLALALSSNTARKYLMSRPLRYLGRISYSLYLVHAFVIVGLIHILYAILPLAAILVISLIVSLALATAGNVYVEAPAIRLGRRLALRMGHNNTVNSQPGKRPNIVA